MIVLSLQFLAADECKLRKHNARISRLCKSGGQGHAILNRNAEVILFTIHWTTKDMKVN